MDLSVLKFLVLHFELDWWLALSKVSGSDLSWGLSEWSLYGCSGLCPLSKNKHVRLTGLVTCSGFTLHLTHI